MAKTLDTLARYIKITAAARKLNCSRMHLYRLVQAGKLRGYTISPKMTLLLLDDVESMLKASEIRPAEPAAQTA